jgi:hypothetical protein
MNKVLVVILLFLTYGNLLPKYEYKICFDIHELIKYTNVYRTNLAFDDEVVIKREDFEIYKDFIYIKDPESRILETIKNDTSNFIREEIGLDTSDSEVKYYYDLYELSTLLDSNSTLNTMIFYSVFKDYIILVEVYNSVSKNFTLYDKIDFVLNELNLNGFSISQIDAVNSYHLFKCDNKRSFEYIGSYRRGHFR